MPEYRVRYYRRSSPPRVFLNDGSGWRRVSYRSYILELVVLPGLEWLRQGSLEVEVAGYPRGHVTDIAVIY